MPELIARGRPRTFDQTRKLAQSIAQLVLCHGALRSTGQGTKDTRTALAEADATPGNIYTRDELRVLVKANRCAPFTAVELLRIHDAKQLFNGRLTE